MNILPINSPRIYVPHLGGSLWFYFIEALTIKEAKILLFDIN